MLFLMIFMISPLNVDFDDILRFASASARSSSPASVQICPGANVLPDRVLSFSIHLNTFQNLESLEYVGLSDLFIIAISKGF